MSQRYFEGASHAAEYALYRPVPPAKLADKIISFLREKNPMNLDICIDVGCGNGQASLLFAQHFTRVVATDISDSQIKTAKSLGHPKNIEFMTSPAENIPAEPGTVQIVSAVQACHWFDLPIFFKEVDRVLCNNGIVALTGYDMPTIVHPMKSEQLNQLIDSFHHVNLAPYYGPGYAILKNNYSDVSLPFSECAREDVWTAEQTITLSFLVKELSTTSGFQNLCAAKGEIAGEELKNEFISKFQTVLETKEHPDRVGFNIKYKYFVVMARKIVHL